MTHLEQARIFNKLLLNDIQNRLFDVIDIIIIHAKSSYPTAKKVFLSGNSNDFGKLEVKQALENAGIEKYFTNTKNFLGWLNSQSS
ncbi:hypothetical protein [Tolypothrix sp. FACHB-123]|uniref:hypothetical protein n=1 Tax=Tolypothrix sp. FACHB-123 TaxID=2692868 RepID=UPI001F5580EE|nr:hypothetical protein [Tolypothrix sp. FACHB-123]